MKIKLLQKMQVRSINISRARARNSGGNITELDIMELESMFASCVYCCGIDKCATRVCVRVSFLSLSLSFPLCVSLFLLALFWNAAWMEPLVFNNGLTRIIRNGSIDCTRQTIPYMTFYLYRTDAVIWSSISFPEYLSYPTSNVDLMNRTWATRNPFL